MRSEIALRLDPKPGTKPTMHYGQLVQSVRGRDTGKWYLVVGELTGMFTHVADGSRRSVERPKRKNVKHLRVLPVVAAAVADQLSEGKPVNDDDIQRAITHITNSDGFTGEEDDDTGQARCD